MVTVSSALTHGVAALPVWAEIPLGTSAATVSMPCARRSLAAAIHASKGARTREPSKPVPSSASMQTSA